MIHLGVTVLVYLIAREIFETATQNLKLLSQFAPLAVALIFGVHPIHTETIGYISASLETFGSLFFFASFFLYIYAPRIRDEAWSMMAKVVSVAATF